jgi:uncharacterized membrane protein
MVDLGVLSGVSSSAYAISADGSVIVGWDQHPTAGYPFAGRRGVVWWEGQERLINPFGYAGHAAATTYNGSLIVGQWHPTNNQPDGLATTYKLGAWDGLLENLGAVRQNPIVDRTQAASEPYAISDDGRVVVGENGSGDVPGQPRQAYIWTPETGMMFVSDYLTSKGVTTHNGWVLGAATAVTPDGRIIAGHGVNPQGIPSGWIATIR